MAVCENILAITVIFSSLRITLANRHVRNYRPYYQDSNNKISGPKFGIFCRKPVFDKTKMICQ